MAMLTSRRFGLWWSLATQWFNTRFERLQTAVSQIHVDIPSDLAKKTDIPTVTAIQSGLAKASDIPAVPTDYAKSSEVTEAKDATIAVQTKMGSPDDDKTKTTIFGKIATISQELGKLTNIFSGISAQDITDELNAETEV